MFQVPRVIKFLVFAILAATFSIPSTATAQRKYSEKEKEAHAKVQCFINIIQDSDFQPQLELLESQIAEIKRINDEIQLMMKDESATTVKERQRQFDLVAETIIAAEPKLKKVLFPHQWKMLNEIHNLNNVRDRTGFGLNDAAVKKMLKLTDEQQEKIAEITKKSDAELRKEIKEIEEKILQLRKNNLKKMLNVLRPDQRKKYKEKFGESPWRFWK